MTRSCINICLLAVISLFLGVIWQGSACAAAPTMTNLGQIDKTFREAAALALDGSGSLYVSDLRNRAIFKFDRYGALAATMPVADISGEGLAVANDGRIFVSATSVGVYADKILILDASGSQVGMVGAGDGEFNGVGDIDFDANGNLYVVERGAGIVKVYAGDLSVGAQFGAMQFDGSLDMSIDAANNQIYLMDYSFAPAPTLRVYDADANLLRSIVATSGFGGDSLSKFGDVAFDDTNRFYVSDFSLGSIRVLDQPATQVLKYVDGVSKAADMVYDAGTARLFALHGGNRVDIVGIDGGVNPVKVNVPPTVPQPVTVGQVASVTPTLIFNNSVDADGDALVYNVELQDAAGVVVASLGGVVEGAGQSLANVATALTENGSYFWRVQADDGQATSAWSALQHIDINALEEAPAAPVLATFLAGENAGGGAVLSWSAVSDPDPNASVGYRVEISAGAALAASGTFASTAADLAGFSEQLEPGTSYDWRVVAVDNTALETVSSNRGRFVYQPAVLKVSANAPDARVYLGGHHGFAGRALGAAPVEVRDLPAGSYAVVVEAPGFEPYVATVVQPQDATVEVAAELQGARLATRFERHGLRVNGAAVADAAAAIVADLDQDGVLDLLLVENGLLKLYAGSLVAAPKQFDTIEALDGDGDDDEDEGKGKDGKSAVARVVFAAAGQALPLPQIDGAAPCLVDWNNDDRLDLLVGGADGSLKLFLGQGDLTYAAPVNLLYVVGRAVPAVADLDADGDKDLLVAAGADLFLYDNVGSDAAPVLNGETQLGSFDTPVAPLFADLDADGEREMLLLGQKGLSRAVMNGGRVTDLQSTGVRVANAASVFAVNFAGSSYDDLVFATADGALVVANGEHGGFAPAFKDALLTKLAALEQLVLTQDATQLRQIAAIGSRIGRGKYDSAREKAEQLARMLGAESLAGVAATQLATMLQ